VQGSVFNQNFATGVYYESINGIITPCVIRPFGIAVAAGATTNIIAGVTGKITLILNMNLSAYTVDNTFQIDSKPAGAATILMDGWIIYKNDRYLKDHVNGVIRANAAGDTIRLTAGAASIVNIYGQYITYTPAP